MTMTAPPPDGFLGHPRGLYVLFFTEMWERFSYYGMSALLVLYLSQHLLFGDKAASLLFGTYGSLVYAMPLLGGLIADRYLGYRKAVAFGAILLVCGHFGMAFEGPKARLMPDGSVVRNPFFEQVFYLSLALIIVGVGFLKANISTIVGQLYGKDDPRRDGGFTIFYMGINIGAFVSTLACGYLGQTYGWQYGFGLAGFGMLFGLLVFQGNRRHLEGHGEPPEGSNLSEPVLLGIPREYVVYLSGLVGVIVVQQLIQHVAQLGFGLIVLGAIIVAWMLWFSFTRLDRVDRDRMLVMMVLITMSILFWSLFVQAGSSITLFTDRNVDMGHFFKASMFQSFNPFFIMLLAPGFAWLWVKLSARRLEPTTPAKFGLGIVQVGLGFGVLLIGAAEAGPDAKVSVFWLGLMYFFHTTGELCLSPVGLSMITKLSVQRIAALMMGVWFLSSSFASYVGGMIAGAMAISRHGDMKIDSVASLGVYTGVFGKLAIVAVALGLMLLLASPYLSKRMHGVH